jgi:hypothetical protein
MQRKPLLALAVLMTAIGAGAAGAHSSWGDTPPTSARGLGDLGLLPRCSNMVDDDGDGHVDGADPGCSGPLDDSEYNRQPPQCSNARDDDGDGKIDLRDPGCSGPQDDDERNAAMTTNATRRRLLRRHRLRRHRLPGAVTCRMSSSGLRRAAPSTPATTLR